MSEQPATEPKRSTLVLVAERAGVSIASVSRVLNGQPASPQLAERVRRAADELGYVPDASARTLKTGRTDQLALAVADLGNPVYVKMMHEVARVAAKNGYRLVLSSTGSDPADQIELLGSLNRGDHINVERTGGSIATFVVDSVVPVPKDRFPTQSVYGKTKYAALRVITCGGQYDKKTMHYLSNIIVYAHLVT